jgi:hypothetical protein
MANMKGRKLTIAWQEAAEQLHRAAVQTADLVGAHYSSLMPGLAW